MIETMRTSVVKLLFKKGDRKEIGNYRPLSMLCCDYKIIAKIAAERMKDVLNSIIEVDQQGFIKTGDIEGNRILVKEIVNYCNETDSEGYMIMMDFKKAYDRVDREALRETLKVMNFGEYFIRIIQCY